MLAFQVCIIQKLIPQIRGTLLTLITSSTYLHVAHLLGKKCFLNVQYNFLYCQPLGFCLSSTKDRKRKFEDKPFFTLRTVQKHLQMGAIQTISLPMIYSKNLEDLGYCLHSCSLLLFFNFFLFFISQMKESINSNGIQMELISLPESLNSHQLPVDVKLNGSLLSKKRKLIKLPCSSSANCDLFLEHVLHRSKTSLPVTKLLAFSTTLHNPTF